MEIVFLSCLQDCSEAQQASPLQAEGMELRKVHASNQQAKEALHAQEARLQQMAADSEAARHDIACRMQAVADREVSLQSPHLGKRQRIDSTSVMGWQLSAFTHPKCICCHSGVLNLHVVPCAAD